MHNYHLNIAYCLEKFHTTNCYIQVSDKMQISKSKWLQNFISVLSIAKIQHNDLHGKPQYMYHKTTTYCIYRRFHSLIVCCYNLSFQICDMYSHAHLTCSSLVLYIFTLLLNNLSNLLMLFTWIGDNKCSHACNVWMHLLRYLIIEKNDTKKLVQCLINGMGEVHAF